MSNKKLKDIIEKAKLKSRKNNVYNIITECFDDLEKCKQCPNYESKCKITLDAFVRESENNYY